MKHRMHGESMHEVREGSVNAMQLAVGLPHGT